ncbi:MAG TPA: hypothetical protein VJL35_05360 [Gemmatimonadaceae bacterium]|nr:hypothetical protein [Gemmatimonadaceae bacterium]
MITDDAASNTKTIIDRAYQLISGPAGEPRDWDSWRKLHDAGARLIPIEGEKRIANVMTPEQFIASRSIFFETTSFYEWESARSEIHFGRLAHVWSEYIAAHEPGGAPIRKGVNSIQLWNDGTRWWILSVAWDAIEALDVSR